MLKIKLARFGKRKQPMYRIIINEARSKRDGAYVANVGHYAPTQDPKILEIDLKAVKSWLSKGAQPTATVAALIKRYESGNPFPPKKQQLSKKAKAKLTADKAAKSEPKADKVETSTTQATETVATEKKSETSTQASDKETQVEKK